ncbi:MAG: hypothetical protein JWO91_3307 [Acidobacteriaceae bacterium]|jgi:hypothetical protein|nr:hypothetical protein [Acidobacteriaceae bacterium]
MPILTNAVDVVTHRLPKVVSPKGHAVIDYITIGTFFIAGALFWRKNKRAALGSLLCGGAELAVNLLTDYPGGISPVISFPTHGKIDIGLAAMAATMPEFLAFPNDREKRFFLSQAGIITVATNLTDFDHARPKLYRVPKSRVSS